LAGICDNGACITSVRGTTGVVDCYDPDNLSGTTQSCIDNVPTTTWLVPEIRETATELTRPATWVAVLTLCSESTDRCYTCSTDEPFYYWQTYIDTNSPTLSWFSCVTSQLADETFYASSITNNLFPIQTSGSNNPTLPVGGIVGIAVGGAVFLIICVALVVCFCFRRRSAIKDPRAQEQSVSEPRWRYSVRQSPHEMPIQSDPIEIDSFPAAVKGANQSPP
jgi:hypothetical protein